MAGTKFFKNFGIVKYKFGDNTNDTLIQDLSQYADVLDQIKQNDVLFEDTTILSGERPDQLSFKLYGTTDYYWTFFLVNDDLRTKGWPFRQQDVLDYAKKYYPHRTVTMRLNQGDIVDYAADGEPIIRTKLIGTYPDNFPVGTVVTGSISGTIGEIVKRNLQLGQLVIDTNQLEVQQTLTKIITPNTDRTSEIGTVNSNGICEIETANDFEYFILPFAWQLKQGEVDVTDDVQITIGRLGKTATIRNIPYNENSTYTLIYRVNRKNSNDGEFVDGEEISYPNPAGGATSGIIYKETAQYNGVHHYEDGDKNWVDIDPFTQNTSGYIPVTYLDRLENELLDSKQIKYIKPDVIETVVREFQRLMRD
jgi:hypothetical protein